MHSTVRVATVSVIMQSMCCVAASNYNGYLNRFHYQPAVLWHGL